jgi:hypothetical protein
VVARDAEDTISILPGQVRVNGFVSSKFLGGVCVAAAVAAAALGHRAPGVAFLLWLVTIVVPLVALRGEGRVGCGGRWRFSSRSRVPAQHRSAIRGRAFGDRIVVEDRPLACATARSLH